MFSWRNKKNINTFGLKKKKTILLRAMLDAFWIAKDLKCLHAENKDWSDCVDAHAELTLRWVCTSQSKFSHVVAHVCNISAPKLQDTLINISLTGAETLENVPYNKHDK